MSTAAAVVMLFGYRTSTATPTVTAPTSVVAGTGDGTSTDGGTAAPPTAGGSSGGDTPAGGSSGDDTLSDPFVGDAAQTHWGPVQVQITVVSGEITVVDLLQVPAGNGRDVQINSRAVPILVAETLQAQGADIDSVSGATVTSDGYLTSLQSALDAAGL